ncbi:MAG: DUF1826 domain-containing protein [Pseudomonadota bacterium]
MNQIRPFKSELAIDPCDLPGVRIASSSDELEQIHHKDTAMVLWRRAPNQYLVDWLEQLAPEQLPRTRTVLRPQDISDALTHVFETAGTPPSDARDALATDIRILASRFAEVTNAPYLRLRLDVVTTNACRRFHVDAITARLICTYRGTGTQYGLSPDGSDPDVILTAETGAPVLLRGSLWPEVPASGSLHRSPPIEGTDETRLVLVLDPMDGPAEET